MRRIAILTSGAGSPAAVCLPLLAKGESFKISAVIRATGRNPDTLARRRRNRLRKIIRIGPLGAVNGLRLRRWYHIDAPPLEEACAAAGLALHDVPHVGSDETAALLREQDPDLALSLGNSFIPERIFSLPRNGMVNLHTERLPQYQNAQSIIWPIHNLETITGLALHRVERKIDDGDILYQETFPIEFHASLRTTVEATHKITWQRAAAALYHLCDRFDDLKAAPQMPGSKAHYTTPNVAQYLTMVRNNRRLYRAATGE